MYKVIIADDEDYICKLIEILIDWELLNMTIVGTANDGEAAYRLIEQEKPEVVITDIRMPTIDGLELIGKVLETDIKTHFIIISGYQDFEYAQKAIKYGVNNYITKPVNGNELYKTLKEISEEITNYNKKSLTEKRLMDELSSSKNKLKNQFLLGMIKNNSKQYDLEKIKDEYNLNFNKKTFKVVLFKINNKYNNKNSNYVESYLPIVEEELKDKQLSFNCIIQNSTIITLLNYDDINVYEIIESIFNRINNKLTHYHRLYLTVGIGSSVNSIVNISESYLNALKSINIRIIEGTEKIYNIENYDFKSFDLKEVLSVEKRREIICYIEILNEKDTIRAIKDIFYSLDHYNKYDPNIMFELCFELYDLINDSLNNKDINNFTKESLNKLLDNIITKNELIEEFIIFIQKMVIHYKKKNESNNSKPIEIAKQYISENYMKDISMSEVSDKVYLNTTYFSELFKKEVGINFSEYLMNYRMDIARELLQDPKNKVCQVAKMVGYNDSKYFSKLFKKNIGVTPVKYRKLNK